jgi:hypothetical protein
LGSGRRFCSTTKSAGNGSSVGLTRVSRSMSRIDPRSSPETNAIAMPVAPARAVRPMR